jgi:hypothetical protein
MIHGARVEELKKPKGKLPVWAIRLLEVDVLDPESRWN